MVCIAVVAATLALLNVAAALPVRSSCHCPRPPLPEIHPTVFKTYIPAPFNVGPACPGLIEHCSLPYELNYFEQPWIVKHKQSAGLYVYTQKPVVVDEYGHPEFHETCAPPAVIVEEVCAPPCAPQPCHSNDYSNWEYILDKATYPISRE